MDIAGGSEYFRVLLSDAPFLKERFDSYGAKETYLEQKRAKIHESIKKHGDHSKDSQRMYAAGKVAYESVGRQVVCAMVDKDEVVIGKLAGYTGLMNHFPNVLSDMVIIEHDSIPQSVTPIRNISTLQLAEPNVQTHREPVPS